MKKGLSLLMICLLMMTTVFVSCDHGKGPESGQSDEQSSEQNVVDSWYKSLDWDEYFQGQPYRLSYTANGDGTCYVSSLLVNPEYDQSFVVEIPEKSPEGDAVVNLSLSHEAIGWGEITWGIPMMLRAETFESLCEKIKNSGISDYEFRKFQAYYLKFSLEGLSERGQKELLDRFPIVAAGDIYVFEARASYDEAITICGYYQTYLEWNKDKTRQCYDEILEMAKQNEDALEGGKQFFLRLRDEKWRNVSGITIPDSVVAIGERTFRGCTSLEEVTIPGSVTSIASEVFSGCKSLKRIGIPDSVTEIGARAFEGCISLEEVTIPGSVTSIAREVFSGCTGLKRIVVSDGVTEIGYRTFRGCTSLEEIIIPGSVTSIASEVFSGCTGLKRIVISDGVTSIDERAFSGCTGLKEVTIPFIGTGYEDSKKFSDAFGDCDSVTRIVITGKINVIGWQAFDACSSLESITIPGGVTFISDSAFGECKKLSSIYFTGTEEEWAKITIGKFNEPLSTATIHYNYVPEE